MKAKQILEQFNKYLNDIEIENGTVTLTEDNRCYHVRLDLIVDNLNNIAVEDMLEKEINKIDGFEVSYIEAERRTDDEEKFEESLNEAMSNEELVEYVEEKIEAIKRQADKLLQRTKYRLLDNVSYTGDQAHKVTMDVIQKCTQAGVQLADAYNILG